MEQWALASRQKEEDNLALQKYQRQDEARIKELNLQIEKMTREVLHKKQELEQEVGGGGKERGREGERRGEMGREKTVCSQNQLCMHLASLWARPSHPLPSALIQFLNPAVSRSISKFIDKGRSTLKKGDWNSSAGPLAECCALSGILIAIMLAILSPNPVPCPPTHQVTETQSAQIQLDKTAEDFRALHAERQQLVRQWEDAVEAMRKRDEAIQAASEVFASNKARIREKQTTLDARARFLANELANNRELEGRISLADRALGKLRANYSEEQLAIADLQSEVDVLKNTLGKAANELATSRSNNQFLQQELETKTRRLETVRRKYQSLVGRLEGEYKNLGTLEDKSRELKEIQDREEAALAAATKEVAEFKDQIFKNGQELFDLRNKEKDLIAEIAGGQSQKRNLNQRISTLDGEVVQQQELLYNVEFQVQVLERKVARAQGERSEEEKRVLNQKLQALNAQLEERVAELSLVTAQVKKVEEDLARARSANAATLKEVASMEEKIAELVLVSDTYMRTVKKKIKEKEDKMVGHDVLRLEVKRLRDILNLRADDVFGLENRKFQLQMSLEERKHETEVHRDMLKAELKAVQDDIHRVTLELRERTMKIKKMEAKYTIMIGKMGTNEDGEPHSQAYYVIKAAQERELLQREGDDLDQKIRKAEKEVRALEATLAKLQNKNSEFRSSVRGGSVGSGGSVGKGNSAEKSEIRALQEKLDRTYDRKKFKQQEEEALIRDVEQLMGRLEIADREHAQLAGMAHEFEDRCARAAAELEDQESKAKRARAKLSKLQKDVRKKAGLPGDGGPLAEEEKELLVLELRDASKAALADLRAIADENPSVAPLVEELVAEAGLRLPKASSLSGSRAGSVRSGGGGGPGSVGASSSRASMSSRGSGISAVSRASSTTRGKPAVVQMQM
eukprot:jgi/Mesvir1/7027/Mv09154-RA.2